MKTPPLEKLLRSYEKFDFDDNQPYVGELTLMFGQLAMCVNPWAGYGAMDRILWAVVGENFRFTCNENIHGYQYARCIEVDPDQLTITMDLFSTENEFDEKNIVERKIFPISEFRRFDLLFDEYIYDQCNLGLACPSDPVKPLANSAYSAAKGAVLGALIGDASGGILEFMGRPPTPKEAEYALSRMPGGGVFSLAAGQFTDDGEMTVTLLQTLCNTQGAYRPDLVAQAYCQWEGSEPFDIGMAKDGWTAVVRHNKFDLEGMAFVLKTMCNSN